MFLLQNIVRLESVGNVKQETYSWEIAQKDEKNPCRVLPYYLNQHKICQNIKFETFFSPPRSSVRSSSCSLVLFIPSYFFASSYYACPLCSWCYVDFSQWVIECLRAMQAAKGKVGKQNWINIRKILERFSTKLVKVFRVISAIFHFVIIQTQVASQIVVKLANKKIKQIILLYESV